MRQCYAPLEVRLHGGQAVGSYPHEWRHMSRGHVGRPGIHKWGAGGFGGATDAKQRIGSRLHTSHVGERKSICSASQLFDIKRLRYEDRDRKAARSVPFLRTGMKDLYAEEEIPSAGSVFLGLCIHRGISADF